MKLKKMVISLSVALSILTLNTNVLNTNALPNNSKASKYAIDHYADGTYNPKYIDLNGSGGDCTNFVSQCLAAGGLYQEIDPLAEEAFETGVTMINTNQKYWYYLTSQNYTTSWVSVNRFYSHFLKHTDVKVISYPLASIGFKDNSIAELFDKAEPGDVLLCSESVFPFLFNHALFVYGASFTLTGRYKHPLLNTSMAGHSGDKLYSLDFINDKGYQEMLTDSELSRKSYESMKQYSSFALIKTADL